MRTLYLGLIIAKSEPCYSYYLPQRRTIIRIDILNLRDHLNIKFILGLSVYPE